MAADNSAMSTSDDNTRTCNTRQARALTLGCMCIFAMGGAVFGVSSIYSDEYNVNLYSSVCGMTCSTDGTPCCSQQLYLISFYSSVAFFVADGAAVLWGEVVDRAGPRLCLALAASINIVGLLLLGFAAWKTGTIIEDVLASVGLVFVGAGCPGVFNGVYVGVLNLEGTTRTPFFEAILATLVAGCFDLSSLVFNLFDLFHPLIPLHISFIIWAAISAVLVTTTLCCAITAVSHAQSPPAIEGPTSSAAPPSEASNLLEEDTEDTIPTGDFGDLAPEKLAARAKSYGSQLGVAIQDTGDKLIKGVQKVTGQASAHDEKAMALEKKVALERHEAAAAREAEAARLANMGVCGRICEAAVMPVVNTICTPHNLLIVALMGSLNLVCSHYIVSHTQYLQLLFGMPTAQSISNTFDTAFPVLGFAAAIGVSPLLTSKHRARPTPTTLSPTSDPLTPLLHPTRHPPPLLPPIRAHLTPPSAHLSRCTEWLPFAVLAIMVNAFMALTCIPTVGAQYAAATLFGPMRTLQVRRHTHAAPTSSSPLPSRLFLTLRFRTLPPCALSLTPPASAPFPASL